MELQTTGFDYAQLDAETRIVVQQKTEEIRVLVRKSAQDVIDIGTKLIDVKAKLGHVHFGDWIDSEFGWSDRTARNFMAIAERFKTEIISDLNIGPTALALLAGSSVPEKARTYALDRGKSGEKLTVEAVKKIIQDHKGEKPVSRPPGTERISYGPSEDDYQPEVPEKRIDEVVSNGHLPANAPVGTVYRNGKAEASAPLFSDVGTNTPFTHPAANGQTYTNGTGTPPVDSRKLMARITELEQRNASQEHNMKALLEDNARLKAQVELNTPKMLIHIVNAASVSQDDANVVMKVHGEATTRAALGLLIQYKVKPHDFAVFSDQLVKLVKDAGKDPLEEQRKADEKAAKKAAKRVYPANVNTWKLQHMMDYYAANGEALDALRHALGIDTDMIHWDDSSMNERREYVKLFQELERTHVSTDCYSKMIAYARSKWADIPVYKMADRISEWKQIQNYIAPVAKQSNEPEIEYVAVSLEELGVLS